VRIGIDATCWWNNRGFGRFTRELLEAILRLDSGHRFFLYVDQPLDAFDGDSSVTVVQVATGRPTTAAAVDGGNRSPLDMLKMGRAVANSSLDVMFFPAVYSWFPVPGKLPTLLTLHDAIAERFPELIFPKLRNRLFWQLKMRLAIANSTRILTVSNAAREEIVQYIKVPRERIDITSEAPGEHFRPVTDPARVDAAKRAAGVPGGVPYIVYVGGLAPHKNLLGLLEGFDLALQDANLGDLTLVLVGDFKGGGFHSDVESLQQRVERSDRLTGRVFFTGFVTDDDLVALYSDALAAAMPSFSEGFGLPAVEAMACGAPLLSSDRGSLPEVVGGGGLYFDPEDWSSIAAQITRLAGDAQLRAGLAEKAAEQAASFTWERAARSTLGHLEALAAA